MKKMTLIVSMLLCCSVLGVTSRVNGSRPGTGRRMAAKVVNRTPRMASTNAVVVADGIWKERPGGLFGVKFGEQIPASKTLTRGNGEYYVTFQPEKRFRKFTNYRKLVDPRTRLVYGLTCTVMFGGESDAVAEVKNVRDILQQKFPKAWHRIKQADIGYGEGGAIGLSGQNWMIAVTMVAPKSAKVSSSATYQVEIRAIDDHFLPTEVVAPPAPSADLDAL